MSPHQLAYGANCIKQWNRDWEMVVVDNACKNMPVNTCFSKDNAYECIVPMKLSF